MSASTLTIDQIIELKKLLSESGECTIHLHDACGGQYFSVRNMDETSREIIESYLGESGLYPAFNADNGGFVVKNIV